MNEIIIENQGPIEKLKFNAPRSGVLLLLGKNGSGKSKALEAISSILSGKGNLNVRDGQSVGFVRGFGCMITFGRQTKRHGELEVDAIESKFNVGALIDPGIKDQLAADAARMKTLLRLLDIKPDASHFHKLVGSKEEFERIVPVSELDSEDIVNMGAQIKRAIEKEARVAGTMAKEAEAKVNVIQERNSNIETKHEHDEGALRTAYETAVRKREELSAKKKANDATIAGAKIAEQKLNELRNKDSECFSLETAKRLKQEAEQKLVETAAALAEAQRNHNSANFQLEQAKDRLQYAVKLNESMGGWEKQITDAKSVAIIPQEAVDQATKEVEVYNHAMTRGVLIRKALLELEEAGREREKHRTCLERSERLRDAAAGVDDVLSSLIKTNKLKMIGGRFVTSTPRSKATYFSELSDGEKWRLAIEITAPLIDEGGIMTAPQTAWQDLDPNNKEIVRKLCIENDVLLITAQATDGELTTKEFKGGEIEQKPIPKAKKKGDRP